MAYSIPVALVDAGRERDVSAPERLAQVILDALKLQEAADPANYIGVGDRHANADPLANVCLDGWFSLKGVATAIEAAGFGDVKATEREHAEALAALAAVREQNTLTNGQPRYRECNEALGRFGTPVFGSDGSQP